MNQAEAYRAAYSAKKMSDKTVWEAASRLMADSKVTARVQELRDQLAKPSIMTAQQRLEWLTQVINNDEIMISDKLRAADIMNKMQGQYVQKIEAEVQTETTINIELVDDDE
jgi:phage terminase small subunit